MSKKDFYTYTQEKRWGSPRSLREKLGILAWRLSWSTFCVWTPKPFNPLRLFLLKLFGATINGKSFVHSRARIYIPWNLTIEDGVCIGDRANLYSLGKIILRQRSTVAQEAYLCTGTHDFNDEILPLMTSPIEVGENAFILARAFILPGVTIGANALVGACAVVTKDVPQNTIVAGNPAREIGRRN